MADKPDDTPKQALDLNTLSGLDFGPNWADEKKKQSRPKKYDNYKGDSRGGRRQGGGGNRDRRSGGRPQHQGQGGGGQAGGGQFGGGQGGQGGQRGGEGRPPRRDDRRGGNDRGGDRRRHAPAIFHPTVKVDLYPQDEAFEALVKRLRSTVRTYQLFEIAHLLLEKPERYVVVVSNKAKAGERAAPLFFSVPGHLPFETEEAAINHVVGNNLDLFFDVEEIEIEAPKGNFQMVNRCSVTGALLGPPNYHRYQEFLQKHYASKISGMSFERFQSKIETVKEQEQIDAWSESMKKGARYTVKDHQEGEPESFESIESARHFLIQHRKDKVVSSGEHVRFAGRDIASLPQGDIRRSVESYIEQQLHFPLDAANNIRGRLRRHKFTVYKKGSKGVSYVCAVKRKFRDSKTVFTDSIRDLIEFIEKHPNTPASKLPKLYIDIDTEKQSPEELKVSEAEFAAAAEAKRVAAEAAAEAGAEVVEAEVSAEVTPDAAASTEATPKVELTAEEQKRLSQLMLDLRWLITEGYVTEYGDGKLFAAPPMPEPKKSTVAPVAEVKPVEAAPVVEAPVAEPVAVDASLTPPVSEPVSESKPEPVADVSEPEVAEVVKTSEVAEEVAPAPEAAVEAEAPAPVAEVEAVEPVPEPEIAEVTPTPEVVEETASEPTPEPVVETPAPEVAEAPETPAAPEVEEPITQPVAKKAAKKKSAKKKSAKKKAAKKKEVDPFDFESLADIPPEKE
ncbi:MAG: hypothetical protein ACSHYA_11130 [Opitutaceae bacterium]